MHLKFPIEVKNGIEGGEFRYSASSQLLEMEIWKYANVLSGAKYWSKCPGSYNVYG